AGEAHRRRRGRHAARGRRAAHHVAALPARRRGADPAERRHSRARNLRHRDGAVGRSAGPHRHRAALGFHRRAGAPRLRLPRPLLPRPLGAVRPRGGRHRLAARHRRAVRAAGAPHPAGVAVGERGALAPRGGGGDARGAPRHGQHSSAHDAAVLRLRGDGGEALRRRHAGGVRDAGREPFHAVPTDDAGRLGEHRETGDGAAPAGAAVLPAFHPGRHLRRPEPLHRRHRGKHPEPAGGARGGGTDRGAGGSARGRRRAAPGDQGFARRGRRAAGRSRASSGV
ncbi:MAG: Voltage-gated sodium channel subunit, partial [uncultured Acetobacteraceae bacterium]